MEFEEEAEERRIMRVAARRGRPAVKKSVPTKVVQPVHRRPATVVKKTPAARAAPVVNKGNGGNSNSSPAPGLF